MYILFLLLIPAVFAFFACKSDKFIFKTLQTLSCFLTVFILGIYFKSRTFWFLSSAFLVSVAGDYFLSYKNKGKNFFVYGIAMYFLAHAGYLLYIVMSFEIGIAVFAVVICALLAGYLSYYFISLKKSLSGVMPAAVIVYLLISGAVLALAVSAKAFLPVRVLLAAGIALIVLSDTIIAEKEFLGHGRFEALILPTYYAAQILLSASFIILNIKV